MSDERGWTKLIGKRVYGRPPLHDGKRIQQYSVGLDEEDVAYLAQLSQRRSEAVRACIEWHRDTAGSELWQAFQDRCTRDGREWSEVLAALLQGYARRPTTEEILAAIERGPQDDSGSADS